MRQVGDFGMSRFQEAIAVNTTTYGTVTHMPPELLMEGKLTKAADVWAFGEYPTLCVSPASCLICALVASDTDLRPGNGCLPTSQARLKW